MHKTLRHAGLDDIPEILRIADKLYHEGAFGGGLEFSPSRVREMLEKFIVEGSQDYLVLLSYDGDNVVGAVVAYALTPLFSKERMATECLLYLDPEYRTGKRGIELLEAYEYWAEKVGCSALQAAMLDCSPPGMAKLYERHGYKQTESVYTKRLT